MERKRKREREMERRREREREMEKRRERERGMDQTRPTLAKPSACHLISARSGQGEEKEQSLEEHASA